MVIINAFILDWGESRYHLRWLGLAIALMLVSPSADKVANFSGKRLNFHLSISLVILILMSTWHLGVVVSEISEADEEIKDLDERYRFTWGIWEGEDIDAQIAGNAMNIGLHSGIETSLFLRSDNPVIDTFCLLYTSPSPRDS